MPYKSQAQRAFFNANPKMKPYRKEWNKVSKGLKLPKRVKKRG